MNKFFHEYISLLSDPAHTAVESTFVFLEFIIFSVIVNRLVKPAWKKMIKQEHIRIDEEHGHKHEKTDQEILDSILKPKKKKSRRNYVGTRRRTL